MPLAMIGNAKLPSHSNVSNVAGIETGGSFGLGSTIILAVGGGAAVEDTGDVVTETITLACPEPDSGFADTNLSREGELERLSRSHGTGEAQVLSEAKLSVVFILNS
mmetsp:Transcript_118525/g.209502  ORF Transcript_118525/g.209502 Transcript_118525/m.209502 type:complete len:107 (+) Transcript_118525:651-971(+)